MTNDLSAGGLAYAAPPTLRKRIPAVLTAGEAATLQVGKHRFGHSLIARCIEALQAEAPHASIEPPAYCRVERHKDGHDWHVDTGDSDHMPWCAYSGSVLLSSPENFSGGWFEFADPIERHRHYLDLLVYSSDNVHRVTSHKGERRVLLMFLGNANGFRSRYL